MPQLVAPLYVVCDVSELMAEAPVPSLPEFGWQLSFRAKSFDDDRTAVCFWGL